MQKVLQVKERICPGCEAESIVETVVELIKDDTINVFYKCKRCGVEFENTRDNEIKLSELR